MENHVILIATGGFWSRLDIVRREVLGDSFEFAGADNFAVPDNIAERVVAIVLADQYVGGAVLDRFPNCRTLARTGTGFDRINLQDAADRGIVVTRVVGKNSPAVAEAALGHLIELSRRVPAMHHAMQHGRWDRHAGRSLSEMTVGVVGLGVMGRSLADLLYRVGVAKILAYNRSDRPEVDEVLRTCDGTLKPLPDVLRGSDAVVLCLASTAETKNIIDRSMLGCLKDGSLLINASRYKILDGDEVVRMLKAERLGGAAFDVFPVEGQQEATFADPFMVELVRLAGGGANIILTPHTAGRTERSVTEVSLQVARNIQGVLSDDLESVVEVVRSNS